MCQKAEARDGPCSGLTEFVFLQNRRGDSGRGAEEGAQWGLPSGQTMRVWQDRGQRNWEGSWGEEIQNRAHKHQTWNPVMSPVPQAGREESGSSCTKFPGLLCGLVSRGSEISPQPAMGRSQVMSAAWSRGHSLRASEQYMSATLLRVPTALLKLLGFRYPLFLPLSDVI